MSTNRSVMRLIALFKLVKASLLFASLVAIFDLARHDDPAKTLAIWARWLHLDPGAHYVRAALKSLLDLEAGHPLLAEIGTGMYATLFLVEGVGLWSGARWAEHLTIVATGGLVPVEIYECFAGPSAGKLALLVLNVAALAYLIMDARQRLQS